MTGYGPFDPGLQIERTELAWRRTALSIAIGSLLSLRVLPLALPADVTVWGLIPGAIGLLGACVLWLAAHRRQVRVNAAMHHASEGAARGDLPGGGLPFALAALTVGLGVFALAVALIAGLR